MFMSEIGEFAIAINNKPPAHAQMHEEPLTGGQLGLQKFCAAGQAGQPLALDALDKIRRKGKAQVRAVQRDFGKGNALHDGGETPADGFNFGELRHGAFLIFGLGNQK